MSKTATLSFLTLALLLSAVGTAYYVYVSKQESYLIDRNFRLLALWGKKLRETTEEYKHQIQYIIISASPGSDDEQVKCRKTNPQQECFPVQCSRKANEKCDGPKISLEKFKSEFEKLHEEFEGKLRSISSCSIPADPKLGTFVNKQPRIKVQLSSTDKDLLHLIYERKREKTRSACKDAVCNYDHHYRREKEEPKQVCQDTVQVDLSISKVLTQLITKNSFSDVILFDSETGKVHFQENTSLYKIDDFRDVVVQRPDSGGFFSFFFDNFETADIQNNKTGSSTPPPLKNLLQNPTHRQITIANISYELFTQPVVLPELTLKKKWKDVSARLILAGLVKHENFEREYHAIPHTWLLVFLFFVLLGLLSLPIIHLGFMDSRERLSPIHVFSLLAAGVFGTALITLFFLDVVWLNGVRHNLDAQLETTAEQIKSKFSYELKKNVNLLHAYDHSDDFEKDFACVTQGENCPVTYHHAWAEESNRKRGGDLETTWVVRKKYPYLCNAKYKEAFPYHCSYVVVFWVDQEKNTRINWTPSSSYYLEASTPITHREYVNRILNPDPKSSLWHTQDGHPAFYAESLLSLGTGKHRVVLSIASSQPEREESSEGEPPKWVAAIETEFQFLKAVAIPDGTGFAVIEDDGGRVLFHSDDKQSLWENFFAETDNDARLKDHVFSRTAGRFQGTYWGKGHSFYSTPLPAVPWSLVVFRNKELFRTANFEAIILACALFALYIIISLIVPVVIWLFNKARRRKMSMSWFWPDSDRYYWCYATIGLIFFLVGIPLFWCDIFPDDYAVWFVFPYLLVSLIFLCLLTKIRPKSHQEISPEQLHRRYACTILALLLLFSALPMGIFFKTGADREMTLAIKYNLITLGHKLRQISDLDFSQISREISASPSPVAECQENECESVKCEQINSEQEGCPLECPGKSISRNNRTLLKHSIHLNIIAETELCVSDKGFSQNFSSPPELFLLERIHQIIRENSLSRLSNPVSIRTLGLTGDQPSGTPFRWKYDLSSSIALDFQAPSKPETKWVILRSWPPSEVWSILAFLCKRPFLGSIIAIACLLVLVIVPIFIVSRIFPILRMSSSIENSNQKKKNCLIIGPPESLNISCAKKENIDCRQISDPLEWWKITRQVLYTQKAEVTLDHFEYQFGVPRFDRAKYELFARLLAKGKQLHVLSTINPLKFAREDDPAPSSPDELKSPASVSLREWSQVFQSFALRYKPGTSLDSESPHAEPHYEALWQARTIDEKITLHHLAQDGFVHAENQDLRHLLKLGLIKSRPDSCWMINDGFEEYVLNAAQRDRLGAKERVKRQGLWHVWKWPLTIVFLVLVMGLLWTQQEFGNALVVMLSLLPVLLPTLSGLEEDGKGS